MSFSPPPPPPPPAPPAPPAPAPPSAFGSLPLPLPFGSAKKMSMGAPSLTTSFSAGIWLSILPSGSGGVRRGLPERELLVAQRRLGVGERQAGDLRDGDLAVADRDQHRDLRRPSRPSRRPSGVWPITLPGGAFGSTFSFGAAASLRLGLGELLLGRRTSTWRRRRPAPRRSWAAACRAAPRARRARSTTGISHHGSHGLLRKTPWEGSSGPLGAAAPPPLPGILSGCASRFMPFICGPCICGPRELRLAEADAARADVHARLVDLRLVDARAVDAGDAVGRGGGRTGPSSSARLRARPRAPRRTSARRRAAPRPPRR